MQYQFLNEQFKRQGQENSEEGVIKESKQMQRYRFTMVALIYIMIYDIFQMILIKITIPKDTYFYYVLGSLIIESIIIVIVILYKQNKRLLNRLKKISFFIFYIGQVYFCFHVAFDYMDPWRIIRNFYILYIMTNFFVIIFLKFHRTLVFIIIFCNFAVTMYIQIWAIGTKAYLLYAKEFVLLAEISFGCYMTRFEYEKLTKLIHSHMSMNRKGMEYIDTLLDNQPSSFFTLFEGSIVYINKTYQNMLHKIISIEKTPEPLNNTDNGQIQLKFTATESEYKKIAEEFLNDSLVNFIDPSIENLFSNDSELKNLNAYGLIKKIEQESNNQSLFQDGIFHFLGIIEYFSLKENDRIYNNVHFRRVTYNKCSWIEVMLSDITLSKKVQNLDEIYRMKENLLSKIAHEFKTPLICVTTVAEQINNDMEEVDATTTLNNYMRVLKPKLHQIGDLSNYTLYLINDIISYLKTKNTLEDAANPAKNDAVNNIAISREKFGMNKLLDSCFRILKTLLMYHQEKINYITPILTTTGDVCLDSDPLRIKQILLNLISNAVKFTKSGKITIKSEVKNSSIVICVEDTGIGIRDEDKHKIFGDGNMLDSHMYLNKMGSGLGLSISHHVAKMLGGDLNFSSHYEFGSKFFLTLPLNVETSEVINGDIDDFIQFRAQKSRNASERIFQAQAESEIHTSEIKLVDTPSHFAKDKRNANYIAYKNIEKLSKSRDSNDSVKSLNETITVDVCFSSKALNQLYKKKSLKRSDSSKSLFNMVKEDVECPSRTNKILIIDDNKLIVDSIQRNLSKILKEHKSDTEVIRGSDGIDLVKLIIDDQKHGNKIKCVLLDENMEYMNGSEAIKIIRKMESEKKIKKVFVCTMSAVEEGNHVSYGNQSLSKPISSADLELLLKDLNII